MPKMSPVVLVVATRCSSLNSPVAGALATTLGRPGGGLDRPAVAVMEGSRPDTLPGVIAVAGGAVFTDGLLFTGDVMTGAGSGAISGRVWVTCGAGARVGAWTGCDG
jgi:hypothetical protein